MLVSSVQHSDIYVCVCVYLCMHTYMYVYKHTYLKIYAYISEYIIFLSIIGYYKILSMVLCAVSRSLGFTYFIYSAVYQSWVFIGRTNVEGETPIFWPPDAKS